MSNGNISLRWMTPKDEDRYARMANALWPDLTADQHLEEFRTQISNSKKRWGILASTSEIVEAGFADLSLRDYVDGCTASPVPMLEGIWVHPKVRQLGIAKLMVEFICTWAKEAGYCELCSDTQLDNIISQHSHISWGFEETGRIVQYRKPLS